MSCRKKVDDTYRQVRAEIAIDEDLDYSFRYTTTFAKVDPVDSIADPGDSTWEAVGNVTLGATTVSGDITTAWITPSPTARIGNTLRLTNTVVTAGGRRHVRLLILKIVNRLALIPEED